MASENGTRGKNQLQNVNAFHIIDPTDALWGIGLVLTNGDQQDEGAQNQSTVRGYPETGSVPDQWSVQNNGSRGFECRITPTTDCDSHKPPSKRDGCETTNRTYIRYSPNNTTTPTGGRERLVWIDTDRSVSLEDGRMPYGSPGNFGEGLGEQESFRLGTIVSITRDNHRGQRYSSEKL